MMEKTTSLLPRRAVLFAGLAGALFAAGCALPLPDKPVRAEPWDLGPLLALRTDRPQRGAVTLALNTVQAPSSIDTTRIMYRLLYAGSDQQPRPYAQARWLTAPPQLFEQRLIAALATTYPVVDPGSGLERLQLQVDLEEFAQFFDGPDSSQGVVRVRAIAVAPAERQNRLLGQRVFVVRRAAHTADAAGGVRALRDASDEIIGKLAAWVDELTQAMQDL